MPTMYSSLSDSDAAHAHKLGGPMGGHTLVDADRLAVVRGEEDNCAPAVRVTAD